MLAAASAEENADSNLFYCHANSSLAVAVFSVNPMAGYGRAKATTEETEVTREHRGFFPVSTVISDFASPGMYAPLNTAIRKRTGNLYQSLDSAGKRV